MRCRLGVAAMTVVATAAPAAAAVAMWVRHEHIGGVNYWSERYSKSTVRPRLRHAEAAGRGGWLGTVPPTGAHSSLDVLMITSERRHHALACMHVGIRRHKLAAPPLR